MDVTLRRRPANHQVGGAVGGFDAEHDWVGSRRRMAIIGSQDLLVGLALVLFFFGAKRLPEIARSLGKSMQEFKKGISGEAEESETSAPRSCASCKTPLDAAWTHCPRCGTVALP